MDCRVNTAIYQIYIFWLLLLGDVSPIRLWQIVDNALNRDKNRIIGWGCSPYVLLGRDVILFNVDRLFLHQGILQIVPSTNSV